MSACFGNDQSPPPAPQRSVTALLPSVTLLCPQKQRSQAEGDVSLSQRAVGGEEIPPRPREQKPWCVWKAAPMRGSKGVAIMSLSSAWSQPLRPGVGVGDTLWVCAEVGAGCKLSSPIGQETSSLAWGSSCHLLVQAISAWSPDFSSMMERGRGPWAGGPQCRRKMLGRCSGSFGSVLSSES